MNPTKNTSARPARVAIKLLSKAANEASASSTTAAPTPAPVVQAEKADDAQQDYLYRLEQLAFNAMKKCELEVGRPLIRNGAAALNDNPAHFDSAGQITTSGVDAIIVGGMAGVFQKLRDTLDNFRSLTRTEINAIRELNGIALFKHPTATERSSAAPSGKPASAVSGGQEEPETRFIVFVLDEADLSLSYQIITARDEEAAERQALDKRKCDNDLEDEDDEDAGFRAVGTFELADLLDFLRESEEA